MLSVVVVLLTNMTTVPPDSFDVGTPPVQFAGSFQLTPSPKPTQTCSAAAAGLAAARIVAKTIVRTIIVRRIACRSFVVVHTGTRRSQRRRRRELAHYGQA